MTQIIFENHQTPSDCVLLKALCNRILSIPRLLIWFIFCIGLAVALVFSMSEDNSVYGVPLIILLGALSFGVFMVLIATLRLRPILLNNIEKNCDVDICLQFQEEQFSIFKNKQKVFTGKYSALIGQYWLGDYYILHFRLGGKRFSANDELFLVHLTEETFDDAYMLAHALTAQKKRLIRIRTKN